LPNFKDAKSFSITLGVALMGGGMGDLQNSWEVGGVICKGDFANHSSHLLWALTDQHRVTQIEVSMVCMERLVYT
jgi:hypothetical protein